MELTHRKSSDSVGVATTIIPFNRPYFTGLEADLFPKWMRSRHLSGDGPYTKRCSEALTAITGAMSTLLTTSCTHALEMSALLLRVQPGDEVIVPAFTFVSTANAFALRGAKIVLCDIRPDTLNVDETLLETLITSKTKCIVVVHYAGVACEMQAIQRIATRHALPIVEDNAHGLFGRYRGAPIGSFGVMATQSFHETKNLQCGEGGALILNDPALIERAEIIREKGTNRSKFFRGHVDKYTWVDIGSSFLPSDILAGFLSLQLERADYIQESRKRLWHKYHAALTAWASENGIAQPYIPDECEQAYHMYYLIMPSLVLRTSLMAHLKSQGILSVFHYQPLNLSVMGESFGSKAGDCPVTEDIADRLLRLPFFVDMTEEESDRVVEAVRAWRPHVLL